MAVRMAPMEAGRVCQMESQYGAWELGLMRAVLLTASVATLTPSPPRLSGHRGMPPVVAMWHRAERQSGRTTDGAESHVGAGEDAPVSAACWVGQKVQYFCYNFIKLLRLIDT